MGHSITRVLVASQRGKTQASKLLGPPCGPHRRLTQLSADTSKTSGKKKKPVPSPAPKKTKNPVPCKPPCIRHSELQCKNEPKLVVNANCAGGLGSTPCTCRPVCFRSLGILSGWVASGGATSTYNVGSFTSERKAKIVREKKGETGG